MNRTSRKEYQKKWRLSNPDKCKLYTKKRKEKYAEKVRASSRKWKKDNPEEAKASRKRSYLKYKDKHMMADKERHKQYRKDWMEWLGRHGMVFCSNCGYDKCFDAIDFHHVNPKEKEKGIAFVICHPISEKGIAEVKKTISLCRNCHAELHSRLRRGLSWPEN